MRSIRVLIVDDSIVFREAISRGISMAPNIEVVGKAVDPYDARDKLLELNPDVMICDVQMPKLNGVEFIKRLLPQYKIPIIVVSSISDVVFDAMDAGAVDFLSKPDARTPNGFEIFINELVIKIRGAVNVNLSANLGQIPKRGSNRGMEKSVNVRNKVIAIGASTGGTEAIYNLLKNLPKDIFNYNFDYNIDDKEDLFNEHDFDTLMESYEKEIISKTYKHYKSSYKVAKCLNISQSKASRLIRKYNL